MSGIDINKEETKLKRAHMRLIKHPETSLYTGVILMGDTEVVDKQFTAYTDGYNKRYSAWFLNKQDEPEATGLALHENLHVLLKHIPRHRDLIREDAKLFNAAADYAANAIIMALKDKTLCKLPKGGLYDPRFIDWSVREIYDYLKTGQSKDPKRGLPNGKPERKQGGSSNDNNTPQNSDPSGGGMQSKPQKESVIIGGHEFDLTTLDEHDTSGDADEAKQAEADKKLGKKIEEALRQGALLAGRFGVKVPRAVSDVLEPVTDWRHELRDFITSSIKGNDEFTWRKFNRRRLADDMYMPSMENETLTEVIVGVDTSGSIGAPQLNEFAAELASICEVCQPDRVRVLWWDTAVHSEQVFTDKDYGALRKLLKPQGGGGTRASCVSAYLKNKALKADCVVMFTDGYTEERIQWEISTPTLWLVTHNKNLKVPGRVVKYEKAVSY